MPPNAKVVVFEDDPQHKEWVESALEMGGHTLLATASSYEEARRLAAHLPEDTQVVICDANLDKEIHSGEHGRILIQQVREHHPGVKIVGLTTDPELLEGAGADVVIAKGGGSRAFGNVIEKL